MCKQHQRQERPPQSAPAARAPPSARGSEADGRHRHRTQQNIGRVLTGALRNRGREAGSHDTPHGGVSPRRVHRVVPQPNASWSRGAPSSTTGDRAGRWMARASASAAANMAAPQRVAGPGRPPERRGAGEPRGQSRRAGLRASGLRDHARPRAAQETQPAPRPTPAGLFPSAPFGLREAVLPQGPCLPLLHILSVRGTACQQGVPRRTFCSE